MYFKQIFAQSKKNIKRENHNFELNFMVSNVKI